MELTTIQTLNLLPDTKDQMNEFIELTVQDILENGYDFKELLVKKKLWMDTIEGIFSDKRIKDFFIDEYNKEKSKEIGFGNAVIKLGSRRSWDYSQCNDSTLETLKQNIEPLKKEIATREKFLQTISKPVADSETGELIYPAAFSTNEFFTVTIK